MTYFTSAQVRFPINKRLCLGNIAGLAIILVLFPAALLSEPLEIKYTFERPRVESVEIDGQMFDRVDMSGAPNSGQVGHPALPARGARILVPYGTEPESIQVITGTRHLVGTDYRIEPVEQPVSLSARPDQIPPLFMDTIVYAMQVPVPGHRYAGIGVQTFRGYRVLVLKLHPVEYVPATGALFYYPEMLVKVNTAPARKELPPLRNNPADRQEAATWIDNPTELSTYASAGMRGMAAYDLLILTHASLASAWR